MPTDARQLGKTIRIGLIAVLGLVAACLLITIALPHKAAAKGVLPELASVELPLANTPLQTILTPVTNVTNELLPLNVNPGSKSIGVKVEPEVGSKQDKPIVSLSIPVQPSNTRAPRTAPQSTAAMQVHSTQPTEATKSSQTSSNDDATKYALASTKPMYAPDKLPYLMPLGSATLGVMAQSERSPGRTFVEKQDFTATAISLVIFFAVIAIIANLLYISKRGGLIWDGDSRLATLSQKYDLTQLSVFAVAMAGAVVIGSILVVAKP